MIGRLVHNLRLSRYLSGQSVPRTLPSPLSRCEIERGVIVHTALVVSLCGIIGIGLIILSIFVGISNWPSQSVAWTMAAMGFVLYHFPLAFVHKPKPLGYSTSLDCVSARLEPPTGAQYEWLTNIVQVDGDILPGIDDLKQYLLDCDRLDRELFMCEVDMLEDWVREVRYKNKRRMPADESGGYVESPQSDEWKGLVELIRSGDR